MTATEDPVTTVMSKLPSGKGDIGAFLVSYPVSYLVVDVLLTGIGLPAPITTAGLASAAVVGAKNAVQSYLESSQGPQTKRALKKRTEAFEKMLKREDTRLAQQTHAQLERARRFWEVETDEDYRKALDKLIAEYKDSATGTAIPAGKDEE